MLKINPNLLFPNKEVRMGVYQIKNKINNKVYIGSSTNLYVRFHKHEYLLKNNKHGNNYLQNSWNKYKEESFEFTIVEYVDDVEDLRLKEQFWLDKLRPFDRNIGYNILPFALSSGMTLPEETKLKISKALKGNNTYCNKGEDHPNSKLNEKQVIEIYNKIKNNNSVQEVAEEYQINQSAVNRIASGKTWKHLNLTPLTSRKTNAKLTVKEVKEIKDLLSQGWRLIDIANEYNISSPTVNDIKKGKSWSEVHK